jgi:hypothetical protein
VVVDRIFGLKFYCLVVLLDCILVLLYFVVSCTEVTVICGHFGLNFDGFFGEFDLFVVLIHFAKSLAFKVIKITGLIELKSTVTAFAELFPSFEVHKGIGLHEVLFSGVRHGDGKIVDFIVVFIGFHDFDFGGNLIGGFDDNWSAIFVVVEFDLHLFW